MNYLTQIENYRCSNLIRLVSKVSFFSVLVCVLCVVWVQPSAYAKYVDSSWFFKINKDKFEFDGKLKWTIEDGVVKPYLGGELYFEDAGGLCGRMRMDFYGGHHALLTTKYGGTQCVKVEKRQGYTVSLLSYESNKVNEVKVSIEKKTASKDWTIIGSETVKLSTVHETVKITDDGFDFGGQTFVLGVPTTGGDVAWTWNEGKATPRVTGTLHINNAASACARIRIKYFTNDDVLLEKKFGGKKCAHDNAHHTWPIVLGPYGNGKLHHITVSLQTLGADDNWRTIGTDSSSYRYVPDPPGGPRTSIKGGK